ncbi:hypothetical protein CDL15_Pgr004485 [Punica granatum]|uniref:Uncharacterized protein n=1 Tax=Punica granatum TaxID=22663 RepID=A0A218WD10_PUNGR|nr:hypothetical protein CDL15_Pgr004485 [Punica granatum]PKI61378.1 hypothetical protein CRG98_018226 [Punica granatum]
MSGYGLNALNKEDIILDFGGVGASPVTSNHHPTAKMIMRWYLWRPPKMSPGATLSILNMDGQTEEEEGNSRMVVSEQIEFEHITFDLVERGGMSNHETGTPLTRLLRIPHLQKRRGGRGQEERE